MILSCATTSYQPFSDVGATAINVAHRRRWKELHQEDVQGRHGAMKGLGLCVTHSLRVDKTSKTVVKVNVKLIYTAPSRETSKAFRRGSHSVTCNYTDACLYFVSVHQMAPPQIEVADIKLQPATHLSTLKGWKAELAWLADLQRTVYPHK